MSPLSLHKSPFAGTNDTYEVNNYRRKFTKSENNKKNDTKCVHCVYQHTNLLCAH